MQMSMTVLIAAIKIPLTSMDTTVVTTTRRMDSEIAGIPAWIIGISQNQMQMIVNMRLITDGFNHHFFCLLKARGKYSSDDELRFGG